MLFIMYEDKNMKQSTKTIKNGINQRKNRIKVLYI